MDIHEEWVKRTNELLEDLEKQKSSLEDEYHRLEDELIDLEQRIEHGHDLVRVYMKKHNFTPTSSIKIDKDKSYPQMLVHIAKQNNLILDVDDATDILLKANIGSNKKSIAKNIYAALSRSQEHFVKIGRKQYRFHNGLPSAKSRKESKKTVSQIKGPVKSGVKEAVRHLKDENPLMTVKDITSKLINTGFDFKGKKPAQAVNMAWVVLGYSKEGKQQKLPLHPSVVEIQVPPEKSLF